MQTIKENLVEETIINKSKFIISLIKVYNEKDALNKLEEIKKIYKDANHNCFAYITDNTKRCSDDKEPSGTAGLPILNILEVNNLNYVLCIVTRYFGGIKLGAGGLIRAYANSTKKAINKAILVELEYGKEVIIRFHYDKEKVIKNIIEYSLIKQRKYEKDITYIFNISNNNLDIIKETIKSNTLEFIVSKEVIIEK